MKFVAVQLNGFAKNYPSYGYSTKNQVFIPVLDQFDSSAVMLKYWTEYEESTSFRNSKNILLNVLQYIFHAWKQTSY